MPPTRSKPRTTKPSLKSSALGNKPPPRAPQKPKKRSLPRGAEKARAAALREELDGSVQGLYDIRPSGPSNGDGKSEVDEVERLGVRDVQVGLEKLKA